ncbi:hypothetical protein XENOCAPTIV_018023, partial [Xenoophorus captivus]
AEVEVGQGFSDGEPCLHRLLQLQLAAGGHDNIQHCKGVHNDADADKAHHVLETENRHPYHTAFRWVDALTDRARTGALHAVLHEEVAGGAYILYILDSGKHQVRYSQDGSRLPYSYVDHSAHQQLSLGLAVGGMHDCQVPVQADEVQDQDTAVQIHHVDRVHETHRKPLKCHVSTASAAQKGRVRTNRG